MLGEDTPRNCLYGCGRHNVCRVCSGSMLCGLLTKTTPHKDRSAGQLGKKHRFSAITQGIEPEEAGGYILIYGWKKSTRSSNEGVFLGRFCNVIGTGQKWCVEEYTRSETQPKKGRVSARGTKKRLKRSEKV